MGDFQQAISLHKETLDARRRVLGEDHPDTRKSIEALAKTLASLAAPA